MMRPLRYFPSFVSAALPALAAVAMLVGCSDDPPKEKDKDTEGQTDAAPADATDTGGGTDAGATDTDAGGVQDTAVKDTGVTDAGPDKDTSGATDAGPDDDTSGQTDAGPEDAGPPDTGPEDAGPECTNASQCTAKVSPKACEQPACVDGKCTVELKPQSCCENSHCDDAKECTIDTCVQATNSCEHKNIPNCCSGKLTLHKGDFEADFSGVWIQHCAAALR